MPPAASNDTKSLPSGGAALPSTGIRTWRGGGIGGAHRKPARRVRRRWLRRADTPRTVCWRADGPGAEIIMRRRGPGAGFALLIVALFVGAAAPAFADETPTTTAEPAASAPETTAPETTAPET